MLPVPYLGARANRVRRQVILTALAAAGGALVRFYDQFAGMQLTEQDVPQRANRHEHALIR